MKLKLYRFDNWQKFHDNSRVDGLIDIAQINRQNPVVVTSIIPNFEKPKLKFRFFKDTHRPNPVSFHFENENQEEIRDVEFSEHQKYMRLNGAIKPQRMAAVEKAVSLFNGKCIVEIGTIRSTDNTSKYTDGWSTFRWAKTGALVYSVDIDEEACNVASKMLGGYSNVNIVNDDGINFLNNFDKPIDLLYLDGWDRDLPESQEKHLEAYLAAKPNLNENSIIVIDDTGYEDLGKGGLAIPKILEDGYKIVLWGEQTCLAK